MAPRFGWTVALALTVSTGLLAGCDTPRPTQFPGPRGSTVVAPVATPTIPMATTSATLSPPTVTVTTTATVTPTASSLVLSGTRVGSMAFGKVAMTDAKAALSTLLGAPDGQRIETCDASGGNWTALTWGTLKVYFDNHGSNKPLESWVVAMNKPQPTKLSLVDGLPFKATFTQLKSVSPGVKRTSLFGSGAPYSAEVMGITYVWTEEGNVANATVTGGPLHVCE